MIEKLIEMADTILDKTPDSIGISCGGPLDSRRGVIMGPPNLPGWDDVYIVRQIENHYGVQAHLQNDANACAVAEWKFGAGRGKQNVVFMTFGTGLGAGLILDGKLYSGTNDNAGELGHIRLDRFGPVGFGKAGSFEGFCSGRRIARFGAVHGGFPALLHAFPCVQYSGKPFPPFFQRHRQYDITSHNNACRLGCKAYNKLVFNSSLWNIRLLCRLGAFVAARRPDRSGNLQIRKVAKNFRKNKRAVIRQLF